MRRTFWFECRIHDHYSYYFIRISFKFFNRLRRRTRFKILRQMKTWLHVLYSVTLSLVILVYRRLFRKRHPKRHPSQCTYVNICLRIQVSAINNSHNRARTFLPSSTGTWKPKWVHHLLQINCWGQIASRRCVDCSEWMDAIWKSWNRIKNMKMFNTDVQLYIIKLKIHTLSYYRTCSITCHNAFDTKIYVF